MLGLVVYVKVVELEVAGDGVCQVTKLLCGGMVEIIDKTLKKREGEEGERGKRDYFFVFSCLCQLNWFFKSHTVHD